MIYIQLLTLLSIWTFTYFLIWKKRALINTSSDLQIHNELNERYELSKLTCHMTQVEVCTLRIYHSNTLLFAFKNFFALWMYALKRLYVCVYVHRAALSTSKRPIIIKTLILIANNNTCFLTIRLIYRTLENKMYFIPAPCKNLSMILK